MYKKYFLIVICICLLTSGGMAQLLYKHNLGFTSLATRWDDGIPLGNGWLGALIWEKQGKLRISLDRVDLWDDRPMPEINKLTFGWVVEKLSLNQYDSVQKIGDEPYEKYPAPTKIPGAALEFDQSTFGEVVLNELDISNGLNTIKYSSGVIIKNYVHATRKIGYFSIENIRDLNTPSLIIPEYAVTGKSTVGNSVEGQSLQRLGYKEGKVNKGKNWIRYHQSTYGNNYYEVLVNWEQFPDNKLIGQWTISNNQPAILPELNTKDPEPTGWPSHLQWWRKYWSASSIRIPDKLIEKQYYLEMYKFGSVARADTPPISLQAIWTADDGKLPPWKGDFHHDLNTELSYWPGYSSNHLDLTIGYTNWLWNTKEENRKWTKQYFGVEGLNVPGVNTITGKPMGGWIQYSMSPTTAAWLSQHFVWQWEYSRDTQFLKKYVYPYLKQVSTFMEALTTTGKVKPALPLSSSPEYHDNSSKAWFKNWTNYDLALVKSLYGMNTSVNLSMAKDKEAEYWQNRQLGLPSFDCNETGLTIAPGQNLEESHRHHAQLMAIYPLGMLNNEYESDREIIDKSLRQLEKIGTRAWCGYSFSWAACVYARAKESERALSQLKIFATNFVAINSFHLNGDQKGGEFSSFTYRPFTLEGNFAFAQGLHEMLLQSYKDYIEVFPATPEEWKDVSFRTLRTKGAFLVSAEKANGKVIEVKVTATVDQPLAIKIPIEKYWIRGFEGRLEKTKSGVIEVFLKKGQTIIFVASKK